VTIRTKIGGAAGSGWLAALALLFAVAAPMNFALERHRALVALNQFDRPDFETGAETPTRVMMEQIFVHRMVLDLAFAGVLALLWLWGRRRPVPAISCGLALCLCVWIAGSLLDPSVIPRGIVVKLLAIGALARALQVALEARAKARAADSR
jgi:hypothetical protein